MSRRTSSAASPVTRWVTQFRLVVRLGVVEGDVAGDRHLTTSCAWRSSSRQTPLSPWRPPRSAKALRERDRMPEPVVVAADGQRRAAAAGQQRLDQAAVTPGWSPSISTRTSQRGSSAPSAAAMDEEQPAP